MVTARRPKLSSSSCWFLPRIIGCHKRIPNRINEATETKQVNQYTPFRYMAFYFTLRKIFTMVFAQTIFAVSIVVLAVLPQVIAMVIDFFTADPQIGMAPAQ